MESEESKLVAAFRRGDAAAFDTLYRRHAGRVMAFARRLTGSGQDAEDLTQEVFVAAFRGLERFEGRSTLLSWLLGIAVRKRRDQARRRAPDSLPGADHLDSFDAPMSSVRMEDRILDSIALDRALAALDEPMREAFLLVAAQGLTHKEAAAILERPIGTVKWRVAEASRRLREALGERLEREADDVREVCSRGLGRVGGG